MKRLIPLCLLCAVLLSGCTAVTVPSELPTAPPTEAAPTLSLPPSETLPSGLTVKTDYSAYAPRRDAETKFTRLTEDFSDTFRPSEDYGAVYPFIGKRLYFEYGTLDCLYGMVDENGRILVDPVYTICAPLTGYYGEQTHRFDFWRLGKVVDVRIQDDVYGEYPTGEQLYALVSMDGAFATDCIYHSIYASGGYIIACREADDALHFDIFDADGNLILNSDDLPLRDRFCPDFYVRCGEASILTVGLKTGEYWGYTQYGGSFVEKSDVYLMDFEGNLLTDATYIDGTAYSDGYAVMQTENGTYQFVDRSGNVLGGKEYSYATGFVNGYSVVTDVGRISSYVIDTQGNEYLKEAANTYLWWDGKYFEVDRGTRCYYNDRFEKIFEADSDAGWYALLRTDDGVFAARSNDMNFSELMSPTGEIFRTDLRDSYVEAFHKDGLTLFAVVQYRENDGHYLLLDSSFRQLAEGSGTPYALTDRITGAPYIAVQGEGTHVYDLNLNEVFYSSDATYDAVQIMNGRIMAADDFFCRQYDPDGSLVFCYPLMSAMGD